MKKKLLSMLLIAAMAVTLVACGTDEKPSKDNNDNKKPTNTVADATETPSGDPVTPYEPGASGPTNATTETPEPEKNVITLLSPDGSKVLHEFAIPDGYTVVSDKKSNHVVLEKDDDATIKVELVSGPCAEVLSAQYMLVDIIEGQEILSGYPYGGTVGTGGTGYYKLSDQEVLAAMDKEIEITGYDKAYFTQPVGDNIRVPYLNKYGCYTWVMEYPEQYSAKPLYELGDPNCNYYSEYHWDLSKHTDYSDYKITSYSYCYYTSDGCLPIDETFRIQITTTFDANKYNVYDDVEMDVHDYINDVSKYFIEDFIEDNNFNMYKHTCEHCK